MVYHSPDKIAQLSPSATFLEQWLKKVEGKKNSNSMSLELYNEKVAQLQSAIANTGRKTTQQQYLVKAFILVQGINGTMKLAKKRKTEEDNILYVVPNEHLYETICKEHIALGQYSNVTKEAIFFSLP